MSGRILIASGGSGGHIFPAIAMARPLKKSRPGLEIRFTGSAKELDRRIFEKEGFEYSLLSDNKMPDRLSPRTVFFLFKLGLDMLRTIRIFMSFRPDVVVGFGGYPSFPAVFVANLCGVPKVIHEQNVKPGRANLFLMPWADRIALSFKETMNLVGRNSAKAVFTGNPIRGQISKLDRSEGLRRLGLREDKFTILVIGGSQGAHTLNEKFLDAVSDMGQDARKAMQVIHITGIKDYEWALARYARIGDIGHAVFSFIDRIEEAYSAADLIVTRSGASALSEIAFFGKAMILVPYPFAMSHQLENARAFSDKGAAITIEEKDLSSRLFRDTILNLFNDRPELEKLGAGAGRLAVPEASENLIKEVIKFL